MNVSCSSSYGVWNTLFQLNRPKSPMYSWLDLLNKHPAFRQSISASPARTPPFVTVQAEGTHEFGTSTAPVQVGTSGVSVTVSDLGLASNETTSVVAGQEYRLPSSTRSATATITGTGDNDLISVFQDHRGDTVVEVKHSGITSNLNLGRIASLTLRGSGGDDELKVSVKNYYGGVRIEGGEGDDEISADVDFSFKRGLTVQGDAGNDSITLSGKALNILVEGGEGNDHIDAMNLGAAPDFTRRLYGNAGLDNILGSLNNDLIYGGDDNDQIAAGAGHDTVFGGEGIDIISGGIGNDRLHGEGGADELQGDDGDDLLFGGAGDDFIYGGYGSDTLYGGTGADNLGPAAVSSREIYAYERVGDHLRVMVRGEARSQPVIAEYGWSSKKLMDYDADEDYLVDRNRVA